MKLYDELEAKLRRAEDRASTLVEAVAGEMVGVGWGCQAALRNNGRQTRGI